MPTYDYICDGCEHAFELFQQMTAPVKRKCPECGERSLRRFVGTGAGILFKGSGFYETDYRSASYRKGAEAEKKATSDGAASKKKPADAKAKAAPKKKPASGSAGGKSGEA